MRAVLFKAHRQCTQTDIEPNIRKSIPNGNRPTCSSNPYTRPVHSHTGIIAPVHVQPQPLRQPNLRQTPRNQWHTLPARSGRLSQTPNRPVDRLDQTCVWYRQTRTTAVQEHPRNLLSCTSADYCTPKCTYLQPHGRTPTVPCTAPHTVHIDEKIPPPPLTKLARTRVELREDPMDNGIGVGTIVLSRRSSQPAGKASPKRHRWADGIMPTSSS